MKISVVVPFCNTPTKMIEELINQLSQLDKKVFEIIFVNDGSDDEVSNFVESKIKNFKYLKFSTNHGVSHARNVGINEASGDYLFFVDSDDLIDLNIANLLPTICRDDLCIFISDVFNTTINVKKDDLKEIFLEKELDDIYAHCEIKGIAMRSACGKLFKTDILKKNKISFDEDLLFYEDAMFVCKYYQHVKRYHLYSNIVYHYRMNEHSFSKKFNKNYMDKYVIFFKRYKTMFGDNKNYLYGLYNDAFNSVLIGKVIVSFKKFHYFNAVKICKNECIVEAASYLLEQKFINNKFRNKLALLITKRHNICAANRIICHQIIDSLKIRFRKIFTH